VKTRRGWPTINQVARRARNHRAIPSLIPMTKHGNLANMEIAIVLIIGFALGYGRASAGAVKIERLNHA